MKTIVFVETNFSGLDALLYCKEKGYTAILITDNPERFKQWFPASCLYKLDAASRIIQVNNSNDVAEVRQVIATEVGPIDAIMTFAEIRTHTVATLAKALKLKGTSVAAVEQAQDKYRFRACLEQAGVDSVRHALIDSIAELDKIKDTLHYPCFVKPNYGHSSIGAFVCRSQDDVAAQVEKLRGLEQEGISHAYVVEEFLEGPLVSVEMLTVEKGAHQVLGIADRHIVGASIEVGAAFPCKMAAHDAIVALARRALDAIGYDFGPSHIEMIVTASGPHLVELNTRVGGSGHSVMMDAALGRSVVGDCIDLCLGKHNPDLDLYQPQQGAAWECYASQKGGTLVSLPSPETLSAMPGVIAAWFHQEAGAVLGELDSNFNWVVQVMCVGADAADAKDKAQACIRLAAEQTLWS